MAYEIVYTSSKAGLAAGSKGFCIVGATNGIPPATLKTLESLSGYRHLHPPAGGPHPSNPTVFSHLILPTGESILSRKCDAGLDYSGRSNNLSHHFVVTSTEQLAAGPARTMAFPGMMLQQWEGDSRALASRNVQSASELSGPCSAWQRATGDAGWAGELANTANNGNKSEAYIVFDEGIDCFPLIDEALSLLPPQDRWQVTFSTFLTALPPNMKCQWRCVMKGSKEYQSMPPHGHIFKFDLTKPLGKAPDSALATAARTGNRIAIAVKAPTPAIVPAKPPTPSVNRPLPMPKQAVAESAGGDLEVLPSPSSIVPAGLSYMPRGFPEPVFTPPYNFKQKKASKLPILMAAIICGLLGLILGGAGVFVLGRFSSNALGQVESEQLTLIKDELVKRDEIIKKLSDEKEESQKKIDEPEGKESKNKKTTGESVEEDHTTAVPKEKLEVLEELTNNHRDNTTQSPATANNESTDTDPGNPSAGPQNIGQEKTQDSPVVFLELLPVFPIKNFDPPKVIQLIEESSAIKLNLDGNDYVIMEEGGLKTKTKKLSLSGNKLKEFKSNSWANEDKDKQIFANKTLYQLGSSDTIELLKTGKNVSGQLPIRFLKPTSIEISDLKQDTVNWKCESPDPNSMQQVWFVEAQLPKMAGSTAPQTYAKKAVLTLEWQPASSQFVVTLNVESVELTVGLISNEDLTRQVQSPLTFNLTLKNVTLVWDNNRKVDVKTSVKIEFKGGIPDPTGSPGSTGASASGQSSRSKPDANAAVNNAN